MKKRVREIKTVESLFLTTGKKIIANSIQELSRKTKISVTSILKIRKELLVKKYQNYTYEQYK